MTSLPASRLVTVCRLLNEAGVRYVIVGGFALALHGAVTDFYAVLAVADDRRHERLAGFIRQDNGDTIAHGGDERIRRAKIDADRAAVRMRNRRLAGLRYLE